MNRIGGRVPPLFLLFQEAPQPYGYGKKHPMLQAVAYLKLRDKRML